MVVKKYFNIQKLSFKMCGIDMAATKPELILKNPLLCYAPLLCAIFHVAAMAHYAYVNSNDFVEVTESLALCCQSSLAIWKMIFFLQKPKAFCKIVAHVNLVNFRAGHQEMPIIVSENIRDIKINTLYFKCVLCSGVFAFISPIVESVYFYCKTGDVILRVPFKASYMWNHSHLPGYSVVFLWNMLSIYNLFFISMAIDTLFFWLVNNISAQFRILCFRFKEAAKICSATTSDRGSESKACLKLIISCIEYHNQTLDLAAELNHVYGEILFVKFLISCTQICCLVFRLSRPGESLAKEIYQCLFLIAVILQLMLYCWNGQRITDESLQVAPEIYLAFDWSRLTKSCQKSLLLSIMRSQRNNPLKAILFDVDLKLFLWAFKTAGSLVTALKTLEENQE